MKLSHICLLGVSLLPFQSYAMNPYDSREEGVKQKKIGVSQKKPIETTIANNKKSQANVQTSLVDQDPLPHQENAKKKKKKFSERTQLSQQDGGNEFDATEQISLGPNSAIFLPQSSLEETISKVETLIQKVIEEKTETPLKVQVAFDQKNIHSFRKAFIALTQKYPFPFSWSLTNKGLSNLKSELQQAWIIELELSSRAKERERVEKEFAYKISDEDKNKINRQNIYDVAMRSGLTLEDFRFNNAIKVRTIELKGETAAEDVQEFQHFLGQTLPKDENPFHILHIAFNPIAKGHYSGMLDIYLREVNKANIGYHSRGTVFDSENGLLYLCLENTHRKMLNLHGKTLASGEFEGRSVKQAAPETEDFIMRAFEAFQEDVTVLTGRGNHINPNGQRGVLKAAFGEWIKAEPFSAIIQESSLLKTEGGYKVIFKEIQNLDLKMHDLQSSIPLVKQTIHQMVRQKKTRLHIILNAQDKSSIYNREFKLMTSVYADLHTNDQEFAKLITPLSIEATSGEIKIIFNHQHSRSPSSFTFVDSYGSGSAVGTIHFNGLMVN